MSLSVGGVNWEPIDSETKCTKCKAALMKIKVSREGIKFLQCDNCWQSEPCP